MENITIIGMKELNQKISRMERSIESIEKSLETIAKIMNRQVPRSAWPKEKEEEDDEM